MLIIVMNFVNIQISMRGESPMGINSDEKRPDPGFHGNGRLAVPQPIRMTTLQPLMKFFGNSVNQGAHLVRLRHPSFFPHWTT